MDLEILHTPLHFQLYGLSATVEGERYAEVGLRLMDQMWKLVKEAQLLTTGINHWVYFAGDRMFVGVEVKSANASQIPPQLEPLAFELCRYARHLHVGPYHDLPQKWKDLKAELASRGEIVTFPSLEVYGHHCSDPAKTETTILLGLK